MKKKNYEKKTLSKDRLKSVSGGNKYRKIDSSKVFNKTGRIIANPLIYKDYDYFDEN